MRSVLILIATLTTLPAHAAQPAYLDDRSTPEAVISSFYNAIDRQEYARAWSYYEDGQGVPAFDVYYDTETLWAAESLERLAALQ